MECVRQRAKKKTTKKTPLPMWCILVLDRQAASPLTMTRLRVVARKLLSASVPLDPLLLFLLLFVLLPLAASLLVSYLCDFSTLVSVFFFFFLPSASCCASRRPPPSTLLSPTPRCASHILAGWTSWPGGSLTVSVCLSSGWSGFMAA